MDCKIGYSAYELLNGYERTLEVEGKRIKGIRYASKILLSFLGSGSTDLLSVDFREAQNFQSWLTEQENRYSTGTILGIIGSLSAFYGYLKKKRLISCNPFTMIDRIRKPSRLPGNIPDEKEMDELLDSLASFNRGKTLSECKGYYKAHVVAEMMYSTGMRISEVAAIKLDDVDLDRGIVTVHDSKTQKDRTAFLNEYTVKVLSVYLSELREKVLWLHNGADETLLFGSSSNLKVWFCQILAKACVQLEREKVTSHIFRHAFGYHMLRSGCDIRKIQGLLGHERLDTTGIYTKVDSGALRNIIDKYHPRKGRS